MDRDGAPSNKPAAHLLDAFPDLPGNRKCDARRRGELETQGAPAEREREVRRWNGRFKGRRRGGRVQGVRSGSSGAEG